MRFFYSDLLQIHKIYMDQRIRHLKNFDFIIDFHRDVRNFDRFRIDLVDVESKST
jgi:hypothetical protein